MELHDWLQLDQLAPEGWLLPLRRLFPPPEGAHSALASLGRIIVEDRERHFQPHPYLSEKSYGEIRDYPREFLGLWGKASLGGSMVPFAWGGWGDQALRFNWLLMELAAYDVGRAITIGATALASIPVYLQGTPAARRWCSERILKGGMAALALTEPGTGSDLACNRNMVGRPVMDGAGGAGFELTGEKTLINGGTEAAFAVTLWRLEKESDGKAGEEADPAATHSLAIVDLGSERVRKRPRYPLSGAVQADISGFFLDRYRVAPEFLIGPPGRGLAIIRRTFQISRGCIPTLAVGAAARAFSEALLYAGGRQLYGRRLLEIDHLRQMLCSMYADLFLASALCLKQSVIMDAFPGSIPDLAPVAKFYGCRVPELVVTRARRLFAGRGFLSGTPIEKIQRDISLMGIFDGAYPLQLQEIFRKAPWLAEEAMGPERKPAWVEEYGIVWRTDVDRWREQRELGRTRLPESEELRSTRACRAAWRALQRLDAAWRQNTSPEVVGDPLRGQRVKFLLAAGWADLQALASATEALDLVPQELRAEAAALLEYASGEFSIRMLASAEEILAHVPSRARANKAMEELRSLTHLVQTRYSEVGAALEGLFGILSARGRASFQRSVEA